MASGTLIDHLTRVWELVDEAFAVFVAGGAIGLTDHDEARLERAADDALDGLRRAALLAGRDREAAVWLPTALDLGDLAAVMIPATAHLGRPPGPVPGRLDLSSQVAELAPRSPAAATSLVAWWMARIAVASQDERPETVAQQLLATARLSTADDPLHAWTAHVQHVAEHLLGRVGGLPRFVAAPLRAGDRSIVIATVAPRARRSDLTDRVPGLAPADLLASCAAGRWTVPAGPPGPSTQRLVVCAPDDLVGPVRAVTLDREAFVCPSRRHREPVGGRGPTPGRVAGGQGIEP
jgi:hypothetical protein